MAVGDAADMADWDAACQECYFSMNRLVQSVLDSGDPATIALLREWLQRWTSLSASLHSALTPQRSLPL